MFGKHASHVLVNFRVLLHWHQSLFQCHWLGLAVCMLHSTQLYWAGQYSVSSNNWQQWLAELSFVVDQNLWLLIFKWDANRHSPHMKCRSSKPPLSLCNRTPCFGRTTIGLWIRLSVLNIYGKYKTPLLRHIWVSIDREIENNQGITFSAYALLWDGSCLCFFWQNLQSASKQTLANINYWMTCELFWLNLSITEQNK